MPPTPVTKVEIYNNVRAMKKGIKHEQAKGWEVVSTEAIPQGWGFFKTCCLGCLFLPLALLGRKPEKWKVQYRFVKTSYFYNQQPR